jgi:hypothetical protein
MCLGDGKPDDGCFMAVQDRAREPGDIMGRGAETSGEIPLVGGVRHVAREVIELAELEPDSAHRRR